MVVHAAYVRAARRRGRPGAESTSDEHVGRPFAVFDGEAGEDN